MLRRYLLSVTLFLAVAPVHAVLTIDITQGVNDAAPIAIVPFAWAGTTALTEDVAAIVAADLRRSGRFLPIPEKDLLSRPHEGAEVNYADWRTLRVDNLVVGKVLTEKDGSLRVQFQLFDVYKGAQITGYSIQAKTTELRRTGHQISDIIYEALTGVRGAFDTNIAYVTETRGQKKERLYQLAVADSDGYNEQIILQSSAPIMSPSWSPDGQSLAYVSFSRGRSEIYIQNIFTRQTERITSYEGINSAPVWSPSGRQLAMTLSRDGNPEIYVYNLTSKELLRITSNFAIDTEPCWLPDGKSMIFTSDRSGNPQLYRVSIGVRGAEGYPQRLTFEGNYNARATVSPNGKSVAMVHRVENNFRIGLLELDSGNFSVLTDGRLDESPSFSPNGSMIIYATEKANRGVLAAVSSDGRAQQRLSLQSGDVREPAWSPFKLNH